MAYDKIVRTGIGMKRTGMALIVLGGFSYGALGGVCVVSGTVDDGWNAGLLQGTSASGKGSGGKLQRTARRLQAGCSLSSIVQVGSGDVIQEAGVRVDHGGRTVGGRIFGDLIAIGRPGEPLPLPGAVRMDATESNWKELVLERMRSAPLVVIRAGAGQGLAWEVAEAFSTLRPEQLVILILNLTLDEYRVLPIRSGYTLVLLFQPLNLAVVNGPLSTFGIT
jgi:hypothetical protein